MDDINELRQELTARFTELIEDFTDGPWPVGVEELARHLADEAAKVLMDFTLEEEEDEPGPSEPDYMREL